MPSELLSPILPVSEYFSGALTLGTGSCVTCVEEDGSASPETLQKIRLASGCKAAPFSTSRSLCAVDAGLFVEPVLAVLVV